MSSYIIFTMTTSLIQFSKKICTHAKIFWNSSSILCDKAINIVLNLNSIQELYIHRQHVEYKFNTQRTSCLINHDYHTSYNTSYQQHRTFKYKLNALLKYPLSSLNLHFVHYSIEQFCCYNELYLKKVSYCLWAEYIFKTKHLIQSYLGLASFEEVIFEVIQVVIWFHILSCRLSYHKLLENNNTKMYQ